MQRTQIEFHQNFLVMKNFTIILINPMTKILQNATTTESPLSNKFDINSSSFGVGYEGRDQNRSGTGHRGTSDHGMVSSNSIANKTNPFLKKSLTRNQPNHDPGVNSDDDDDFEGELGEDDMFRQKIFTVTYFQSSIDLSKLVQTCPNLSENV